MVLVHEGLIEGHLWPFQAPIGVAVGSFLTQVASSCEDNIISFFQSGTSLPGAIRKAPSLQRPPQRHGRDIGIMGLDEILPELPHTNTLASSILGPYILTNDGLEIDGSTILGFPARLRSLDLAGVPMLPILGHNALYCDFSNIQALGCAQCGIPGRYFLLVLPLLIKSMPPTLKYEPGVIVTDGDLVIVHGRFSGFGAPVNWIAADILRIEDGVLVEHWDVIQDEATQEQSKSGRPMFGDSFPVYR